MNYADSVPDELQRQEDELLLEIERLGGGGPQAIGDKYKAELTVRLAREIRKATASADLHAKALFAVTIVLAILTLVLVVRALQGH